MFTLILFMMICLMLSLIVGVLGWILSKKMIMDREKMSPFECGFTPKSLPRQSFSLRFFLISLIFLIFDVELVLLFPFVFFLMKNLYSLVMMMIFLIVLFLSLIYEVNQGVLNWAN